MMIEVELSNPMSPKKFKTIMLNSSLCDYSDVYIPAKETTLFKKTAEDANRNNTNKKMIFILNYVSFTNWISQINNTNT